MSSFSSKPLSTNHDSSEDDDDDYVPPQTNDVSSSSSSDDEDGEGGERDSKRPRIEEDEPKITKETRKDLWDSFQASLVSQPTQPIAEPQVKLVKIEKRYKFAGDDVIEVIEVPEDSEDAKKWPRYVPPSESSTTASPSTSTSTPTPTVAPSTSTSSLPPPKPRPGPRKSKLVLPSSTSSSSSKPQKLTTLSKSALDWSSHLSTSSPDIKHELESNRKGGGGGYLEKVEFLERVGERRERVIEDGKGGKRRRG